MLLQLVVIPVPLERSILTNVCLPQLRGRANALVSIVDDLGKGLGPALVSLLISQFDRETAFNISLIGWIVGGLISLAIMIVSESHFDPISYVCLTFCSLFSLLKRMKSLSSNKYGRS